MRTITFAADNPQAGTWFLLLYQSFTQASPGPRPLATLAIERDLLQKFAAISVQVDTKGGVPSRMLHEPGALTLTDTEFALIITYLAGAGFQPYLSPCVLDLHAALSEAPRSEQNDS